MKEKNVFRRIGITGGIASGKSTVTTWLKTHGYPVWDADAIYETLTAKGSPLLQQIAGRFGPQALTADGTLHRSYLAERVFSDPVARKALDALTHPAVYQEMARQAAAWEEMQRADTTSTNRSESSLGSHLARAYFTGSTNRATHGAQSFFGRGGKTTYRLADAVGRKASVGGCPDQ